MKSVLFCGIIVLGFVSGKALKCYSSLGIDKPFSESDCTITCSKRSDMCFQLSAALSNGSTVHLRTCLEASSANTPEFNDLVKKLPAHVKLLDNYTQIHCGSDYCNGAKSIIAGLSIVFVNLLFSIF